MAFWKVEASLIVVVAPSNIGHQQPPMKQSSDGELWGSSLMSGRLYELSGKF